MGTSQCIVNWGKVEQSADRILIVATGPSVRLVSFDLITEAVTYGNMHVMAVKDAVTWLPECHSWITCDPNDRSRPLMKNQRDGVRYYAAVPDEYGQPNARRPIWRNPPEPNVVYLRRLTGPGPLKSKYELSEHPTALHTGNSCWTGLGLAYLMKAHKIAILGLDGTREGHAFGCGRPRGSLAHLPTLFGSALPQLERNNISVYNGSPMSTIDVFPRMTPNMAIEYLMA